MLWINGMSDIIPAGTTEVRLCRYEPIGGGCYRFYIVHPAVEDTVDPKIGHPWVELCWQGESVHLSLKRQPDWQPGLVVPVVGAILAELRQLDPPCRQVNLEPIPIKGSRCQITQLKRLGFYHAGTQCESGVVWRGRRRFRRHRSPHPKPYLVAEATR